MRALLIALLTVLSLGSSVAQATTYKKALNIEEMSQRSEQILMGSVANMWTEEGEGDIWTVASVMVESNVRGAEGSFVEIRWMGGVGESGIQQVVSGAPNAVIGDRVMVFVRPNGNVVGMAQGLFQVDEQGNATRDLHELDFMQEGELRSHYSVNELMSRAR